LCLYLKVQDRSIFLKTIRTNLSFSNFILREFAHFITCDIYIKKKISNCTRNTRLSHPCLQSVYENVGNAHADIYFYKNMFTVTQVLKLMLKRRKLFFCILMNLTSHSVNREIWVKPHGTDIYNDILNWTPCETHLQHF
jgi:hypothetical protein